MGKGEKTQAVRDNFMVGWRAAAGGREKETREGEGESERVKEKETTEGLCGLCVCSCERKKKTEGGGKKKTEEKVAAKPKLPF